MGWFDQGNDISDQYSGDLSQHEPSKVHELLGGAAAFEAAKAWENHQIADGKPANHAFAKEALAGVAGAFIDREVETRGLDEYSKVQAKRHAQDQIDRNFDQGAYDSYQQ